MIKVVGDYFVHEWYSGILNWVIEDGKNDLLYTCSLDDVIKFFADKGINYLKY